MSIDWEHKLRSFRLKLSESERTKYKRTFRMIREAIRESPGLESYGASAHVYGSYRNGTNLRAHSDIDVFVSYDIPRPWDLKPIPKTWRKIGGRTADFLRIVPDDYARFKELVGEALVEKFEKKNVQVRRKAIGISKNSSRISADVIPCFVYQGSRGALPGIELWSREGDHIIGWPQHHFEKGLAKSRKTECRYKYMVRALKSLKREMEEKERFEPQRISSYLLECLVYNVPNEKFRTRNYSDSLRNVLSHLRDGIEHREAWPKWREVHGRRYLVDSNFWRADRVHAFTDAAWRYVGF